MRAGDFEGVGLAVGSVFGLRSFDVTSKGELTGRTYQSTWKNGQNISVCGGDIGIPPWRANPGSHHDFDPNCGCGFWAYWNGDNDYATAGSVTGVIEGYGRTVLGERGFRCNKAKIRALVLPDLQQETPTWSTAWRDRRWFWGVWLLLGFAAVVLTIMALGESVVALVSTSAIATAIGIVCMYHLADIAKANALARGQIQCEFMGLHPSRCECSRRAKLAVQVAVNVPGSLSSYLVHAIKKRYPDVEFFSSVSEMLKKYPLASPEVKEMLKEHKRRKLRDIEKAAYGKINGYLNINVSTNSLTSSLNKYQQVVQFNQITRKWETRCMCHGQQVCPDTQ